MPKLDKYLNSFGIRKGLEINGFVLTNIKGEHKQIIRFRKYEYPLVLTFERATKESNPVALLAKLSKMVAQDRVIYSPYGNPYKCSFGHLHISEINNNKVVIKTIGSAIRI